MHRRTRLAAALAALSLAPLLVAAQQSPSNSTTEAPPATQCSVHYVRPGETYISPEGVKVTNRTPVGGRSVWVRSFPADATHPRPYVLVEVQDHSLVDVSGLETGDTVTIQKSSTVTIIGDDFGDTTTAPGYSLASGGVNVLGDKCVVLLRGSNNDVDFKSGTHGSRVEVLGGGTGNDIDLNGTDNTVSTPQGQNVHD